MPELPEVETTRRGIEPYLTGTTITNLIIRQPALRWPIPDAIKTCIGEQIHAVKRRAKFLILETNSGQILLHLGMSGTLRVLNQGTAVTKHDHLDIELSSGKLLRLNDPRRFGAALWAKQGEAHPLLGHLGPEPLTAEFDNQHLFNRSRGRKQAIKTFIMDNKVVVGVGNIYAQEALFMAGIHPARAAGRVSKARYEALTHCIRKVLSNAIKAGGTTLKDFTQADGQPGYFAQSLSVYGRQGENCLSCNTTLKGIRQGQRSTCYCPQCQR